ncbi:MAG: DUF393 domain-containing protein [Chloroflexi bacterium]|nr:DUF393 domain-containing protein [Chloroflexota bacterium]
MRQTAIVAVFDGHCVICHTTRRIVQALDWFNRVEFLDLHDQQQVRARFPQIDRADAMGGSMSSQIKTPIAVIAVRAG